MLGSTSWWSYDRLPFASFLLLQCATSRIFHHPGKPLLNLDTFSSLDIHSDAPILLHGSTQCAKITPSSLGAAGCCWRGVWVWAHRAEQLKLTLRPWASLLHVCSPPPAPWGEAGEEGEQLLAGSEGPHTNRGDLTKPPAEELMCWALQGLLKSSSLP